jgi:hypothetical protein
MKSARSASRHPGARQAHQERRLIEGEGKRGQDQRLAAGGGEEAGGPRSQPHRRAAPEGRQPAERDRESPDQQETDQERRQADADQRQRLEQPCRTSVGLDRREDARRHPEAKAQKRGAERQFQRRGKALLEQVRDRLAQPIRRAEVEARRLAEVAHGLRRNGIVQPERAPDRGALGWRRIGADHLTHRIAGGADDRKGDQADRHEDAGRLQDAGEEEGEHGMRYPPRYPVGRPKTRVL